MSFSSNIKEELSKLNTYSNKDSLKFEIMGYLISNAILQDDLVIFSSENVSNIKRIYSILRKIYNFEDKTMKSKNKNRTNLYVLSIKQNFFDDLVYVKFDNEKNIVLNKIENINTNPQLIASFLRGIFMGNGSIVDPNTEYHLDISFKDLETAENICDIALYVDINFKITQRKNEYIIYLKEGQQISDFLTLIGANASMLRFEEIRVVKDVRNNVNRLVNCETANLNKTVEAAVKVINDIKYLKKKRKFDDLPENLKEIAEARLKNPNASLKELGQGLKNPLGKSGVNHRLKKISEIAEEIRGNT